MNFTTAVFDMDGTLFDSERLAIECWQTAFRDIGVLISSSELEAVIGVDGPTTRAYLNRYVPEGTGFEELMLSVRAIRQGWVAEHGLTLKPGAVELLSLLHGRGVRIGLATTTHTERTLDNLHGAGIARFFRAIVCGDQVAQCKPHPEIYLKALAELEADCTDAVALEDSVHGIIAAHAAGMRVIHIPDIKKIDAATERLVHRQFESFLELHDEIAG
ncbi:MAG: HAD family hydrolase [Desulfuromonadaceae bacterium]